MALSAVCSVLGLRQLRDCAYSWSLLDFTFTQYDPLGLLGTYGIICHFLFVFKNKRVSVSLPT